MTNVDAGPAARLLVVTRDGVQPRWTSTIDAPAGLRAVRPELDGSALADELGTATAVFIDADVGAPLSVARRVHRIAPGAQIAIVAAEKALDDLRRAMLFAPGIGEVWLLEPDAVTADLIARACDVGASRRRHTVRTDTVARTIAQLPRTDERRVLLADRYLAVLLELLPDPVIALDDDDSVLFANPAASRMLGLDGAQKPSGVNLRARLEPEDPAALDALLAAGRRAPTKATLGLHPGGEDCTYDVAIAPIAGERPARALLLHDVTEQVSVRMQLEEQAVELETQRGELQMQNEELEAQAEELAAQGEERERALEERDRALTELRTAMQHRSRFYAGMSHELRTPINAIIGYNDLMLTGVYGEPVPEQAVALERVRHAANHLLELVNDVLDLSKIEAGKLTVTPETFNVAELLDDLGSTMQPLADANNVEVRLHSGGRCEQTFVSDPRRLRQIVMNLLSNAIRYGGRSPVAVGCVIADDTLRVDVVDQGPGIPPEELGRIFDEFVQVGTPSEGGTGLGLPIGRALAQALGGTLTATSTVGKGSRFTLRVPRMTAGPPP